MKKKFISVLAALMVLSMGTTAFAANSPTTLDDSVTAAATQATVETVTAPDVTEAAQAMGTPAAKTEDGTAVTLTVTAVSTTVATKAADVVNEQTKNLSALAGKGVANADKLNSATKVTPVIAAMAEVEANGFTPSAANPIDITFTVSGITADSIVMVLHQNGTSWESMGGVTLGTNTVTVRFTSLSPIAIVTFKADTTSTSDNNTSNNNSSNSSNSSSTAATTTTTTTTTVATTAAATDTTAETSPKTGAELPMAAVIAILCAAGVAVCTRKATR